jgi:hypothetical protein
MYYLYSNNFKKFKINYYFYKKLKYNIIILNYYKKHLKLNIKYFNKYNLDFSVGTILKRYGVIEKYQKKSNKGEKIFFEYLTLYILKHYYLYTKINYSIFKVKQISKNFKIYFKFLKFISKKFKLKISINQLILPNNFNYNKKIKSIKRKFKKKNIKFENNNIL